MLRFWSGAKLQGFCFEGSLSVDLAKTRRKEKTTRVHVGGCPERRSKTQPQRGL